MSQSQAPMTPDGKKPFDPNRLGRYY